MHKYYDKCIESLGFSTRTYNALKKEGILTIKDLLSYDKNNLRKIPLLGKKSLEEIETILKSFNSNTQKISRSIFKYKDGGKYYDINIGELNLSTRIFNCLKREGINFFSQLYILDKSELSKIPNLGNKSIEEVIYTINNIKLIPFDETLEYNKILYEDYINIINLIRFSLEPFILVDVDLLLEDIKNFKIKKCIEEDEDIIKFIKSNEFVESIINGNYLKILLKNIILNILKHFTYGLDINTIISKMPNNFKKYELIESLLIELYIEKQIEVTNDELYIIIYPSFLEKIYDLLEERQYLVIKQRIEGKTLQCIGDNLNITRERIRQIEKKALTKINNLDIIFKEDFYKEVYQKYNFTQEEFIIAFKDARIYNYLDIRYNKQKGKEPLENILEDKEVPLKLRCGFEKSLFKDYIKINNEYVKCTRINVVNYILKKYAKDEIEFSEFKNIYDNIIDDIKKYKDIQLEEIERGYENRLSNDDKVLWKYKKKFRYYNINEYNFEELLDILDLKSYNNVEYSTFKFFIENSEIMELYDIRDEYELHNLLKKICKGEEYKHLNFKRMPNIEFGVADREKQVLELLKTLAPIEKNNFAKAYQEKYGVREDIVKANYLLGVDKYLVDGYYEMDFTKLDKSIINILREILKDDIYFYDDIKNILIKQFQDNSLTFLDSFTLKNLGFKTYVNYIIKNKFNTGSEYFKYLLTKDDKFDLETIPKKVRSIITFSNCLYNLKLTYSIIEYLPKKYINFNKLENLNIKKEHFEHFIDEVISFVGKDNYFTMHSIKQEGFKHNLEYLGFDDYFYTSILIESKNNIQYKSIGKNRLMKISKDDFYIEDFIQSIVYKQENFKIDIYDLMEILNTKYNIFVNIYKVKEIIRNSSMFYDAISEKIFIDYDFYFEEV